MKINILFSIFIFNINVLNNKLLFAAKLHAYLPEVDDIDNRYYKFNEEQQLNDDEKIVLKKSIHGDNSENSPSDAETSADVDRDEIVKKIVLELRNYVKKITEGLNSIESNITSDDSVNEMPEIIEEPCTPHPNTTTSPKHEPNEDKHTDPKHHFNNSNPPHNTEPKIHKIHDDKSDETSTTESVTEDPDCIENTKKDAKTTTTELPIRSIKYPEKVSRSDNEQQIEYDIVDPDSKIEESKSFQSESDHNKDSSHKTGVFDPFFNQILYPIKDSENLQDGDDDSQQLHKNKYVSNKLNAERKNKKRDNEMWTDWSDWTGCSVSCGNGKQLRYRKCANNDCEADIEMDEKNCAQPNCQPELLNVLSFF